MKKLVVWDHVSDQISELLLGTEIRNTRRVGVSLENVRCPLYMSNCVHFEIFNVFRYNLLFRRSTKSISVLSIFWLVEVVLRLKTYNVLCYWTKYEGSLF